MPVNLFDMRNRFKEAATRGHSQPLAADHGYSRHSRPLEVTRNDIGFFDGIVPSFKPMFRCFYQKSPVIDHAGLPLEKQNPQCKLRVTCWPDWILFEPVLSGISVHFSNNCLENILLDF